jgi:hypothetical protein
MDEQTVAVSLPTDVVYVSGTVNGMEYTWTNVDTDRWEAVVARTESEIYVVALTLINDLGTVSEANFTLYYGVLNLVTDRTERDVERWRLLHSKGYAALTEAEKAEWDAGMKGAYNYEDMNRVESAVIFIANRLAETGQYVTPEVHPDWHVEDHPTKADMDRYLGNIALLRTMLPLYPTTPKAPTTNKKLDYLAANDIEIILADLDRQISAINQSWYYAGDVYVGEV